MIVAGLQDLMALTGVSGSQGSGYVYFAQAGEWWKIGHSRAPQRRLNNLNARAESQRFIQRHGFPHGRAELVLAVSDCGRWHERGVHSYLAKESKGYEWFAGDETERLVAILRERAAPEAPSVLTIGQTLLRSQCKRLSQVTIAGLIGCHQSTVANWANGQASPSGDKRSIMERNLGIPYQSWMEPAA